MAFTLESFSSESRRMSSSCGSFGVAWPHLNDGLLYSDVVPNEVTTLIHFYSTRYGNSAPLQGWLQRIRNGQITVDGHVITDPHAILRSGSEMVYRRLPWMEPDAPHMLHVLYEDDHMMALNKPSGLQVLPGGLFQQRTLLTQLRWRNPSLLFHHAPVHRLGRGTSGILLCAKTKIAKTRLAAFFADGTSKIKGSSKTSSDASATRKISKIYRALASGLLCEDKVTVEQPIGIIQYPGVAKGLYVASSSGKPALSKVEVLQRDVDNNCTLVQVEIESGRPHQIRIHLAYIGHPLLGDPLYGVGGVPVPHCSDSEPDVDGFAADGGFLRPSKAVPGDCGYSLHAYQLILSHPTTDEVMKIIAPLPDNLRSRQEMN